MLLSVNGLTATLVVNNQASLTHTFAPRVIDGYSYGLNYGFVGFGSDNSRGSFDNATVQVLPPQITSERAEDFDAGAGAFAAASGTWSAAGGRYDGTSGVSLLDLGLGHGLGDQRARRARDVAAHERDRPASRSTPTRPTTTSSPRSTSPGQRVLIGHVDPRRGFVIDASVARALTAGAETVLSLLARAAAR